MNTGRNLPATLAAEIVAPCNNGERHRIWVHRDGTVTTPDHSQQDTDDVARALGHTPSHPCARFQNASNTTPPQPDRRGIARLAPPNLDGWCVTTSRTWTALACWTTNSAIIGAPTREKFPPTLTLAYLQAYQEHHATPHDLSTHLRYLISPWSRITGWRRTSTVEPEELRAILRAGIPGERAATALTLGLTAATATEITARLGSTPERATEMLLLLAHAMPPMDALQHIPTDGSLSVGEVTLRCQELKRQLEAGDVDDTHVPALLFSSLAH